MAGKCHSNCELQTDESNISTVSTVLEQSSQESGVQALLKAILYQVWKQCGELLSHHCKLYLLNEKILGISTSLKTFTEFGLKYNRKAFAPDVFEEETMSRE